MLNATASKEPLQAPTSTLSLELFGSSVLSMLNT